jgi:hypothetical protein
MVQNAPDDDHAPAAEPEPFGANAPEADDREPGTNVTDDEPEPAEESEPPVTNVPEEMPDKLRAALGG